MIKPLALLLLFILLCQLLPAQLAGTGHSYLSCTQYTTENGLSQNSIYSICQTTDGLMWFGTQDGLNQFDGKRFTNYKPPSTCGQVTALYEDKQQALWVGTCEGIELLNRVTGKFTQVKERYPGFEGGKYWYKTITGDTLGNIWLLTATGELLCYNKALKKMAALTYAGKQKSEVIISLKKADGKIFAAAEKNVYVFQQGVLRPVLSNSSAGIRDIAVVDTDCWMITEDERIMIYTIKDNTYKTQPVDFYKNFNGQGVLAEPTFLYHNYPGELWIASRSDGLIKVDLAARKYEHVWPVNEQEKELSLFTLSLYQSPGNITWIGLSGDGISKFSSVRPLFPLWRNEVTKGKQTDNMIYSLCPISDSEYYMGTSTSGIAHLLTPTSTFTYYKPAGYNWSSGAVNTYSIIRERDNALWVCSWAGLYQFNILTKKFTPFFHNSDKFTTQLICAIPLKNAKQLIVSSWHGGFKLFNKTNNTWEACNDPSGILLNQENIFRARYMKEMEGGNIFVSSERKGFFKYNYLSGQFTFYPQISKPGITSRYFLFTQKHLWVATDDGLIQADKTNMKAIKKWTIADGLPNNYIYSIEEDSTGKIWISTNHGVASIEIQTGYIRQYTDKDGLQSLEFNTAVVHKDSKGMIWMGGVNGLNKIDPAIAAISAAVPSPLITGIQVMNRPFTSDTLALFTQKIRLSVEENFIGISYQSPYYGQTGKLMYQYKMDGIDKEWINDNILNFANYPDLKSGSYTFYTRASLDGIKWSPASSPLLVVIVPHWYQTSLFWILLITGLLSIAALLVRQRIRSIRQNAALKQKITETEIAALKAQMNPHFIFNCINSIDAFIHSNDKYNATLYLNKFAKLLRNILDSSKQNTVLLTKDIDTLKLYVELEELRHENKFKTSIIIDDALLNNDYKVPPLIVQPFVENAILHGLKNRLDNNGLLLIQINKTGDKIEYGIKDNGIGRKAAQAIIKNKESSYGMQISFDRVKLFNNEDKPSVQINDLYKYEEAAGTEVKIQLNII